MPQPANSDSATHNSGPINGPLRVHLENPRYFADAAGKVVYLTGAHTWNILPDMSKITDTEAAGEILGNLNSSPLGGGFNGPGF